MDALDPQHLDWISDALARLGLSAIDDVQPFKLRPWSTVAFVDTDHGRVWFKANEPALAFEAELLTVLARIAPGLVLEPLHHDPISGWFLSPDAGAKGSEVTLPVADAVDAIVAVQRATSEHVDDVLGAGTPDRRPTHLSQVLMSAIEHPSSGRGGARCAELQGRFAAVCDRLTGDGRLAVVNSDHKPDHVFTGPPVRVYDWGDAVVCHPLVDVPFIEREFGADAANRFTSAWGHGIDDPIVQAAGAAAELVEADVWLRTSPAGLARHPDGIEIALGRLADRLESMS